MKLAEIRPEVYGFEDKIVTNRLRSILNGIGKIMVEEIRHIDFQSSRVLITTFYASQSAGATQDFVGPGSKETGIALVTGIVEHDVDKLSDDEMLRELTIDMSESVSRFIKHAVAVDIDPISLVNKIRESDFFTLYSGPIKPPKNSRKKILTIWQKTLFGRRIFRFLSEYDNVKMSVDLSELPIVYGNEVVQDNNIPILDKMKRLKVGDWLNDNELEVSYGGDFFVYNILDNTIGPKKYM